MISVVILTKNEEKHIGDCLDSVSWCDEKIVIDDHSDDKTVEIARKKGAKVFTHSLHNDFSEQRNFGLEKAQEEWVLFIDADERVSSALWYEVMQHISESIDDYAGFYLKRQDTMWNKVLKHGETGNVKLLRLAKKGVGKWEGDVHEQWKVNGKMLVLQNPLDHFPHSTVADFLQEINFYTDLRAEELFRKKTKSNWMAILAYPKAKFFLNYFIRRGFLDGLPGLVVAILMSLHSFLVRAKLWLMWQKNT